MNYREMIVLDDAPPEECDDCHAVATWFDNDSGFKHCDQHKEEAELRDGHPPHPAAAWRSCPVCRDAEGDLRYHGA